MCAGNFDESKPALFLFLTPVFFSVTCAGIFYRRKQGSDRSFLSLFDSFGWEGWSTYKVRTRYLLYVLNGVWLNRWVEKRQ